MYKGRSIFLHWKNNVVQICKYTKSNTKQFTSSSDHRAFLDKIAQDAQFTQMSDWYNLETVKVSIYKFQNPYNKPKLKTILPNYKHSVYNLLSSTYPEYDWLPWKLEKCTPEFWEDANNQRKFVQWVENELKIKEKSDWYNVDFRVING